MNLFDLSGSNDFMTLGLNSETYIELEFSGYVRWEDNLPAHFDRVSHVIDNIWRVYMSEWMGWTAWTATLDHIGSPFLVPTVRWAHVCPGSAAKTDLSAFAANEDCKILEKFQWGVYTACDLCSTGDGIKFIKNTNQDSIM